MYNLVRATRQLQFFCVAKDRHKRTRRESHKLCLKMCVWYMVHKRMQRWLCFRFRFVCAHRVNISNEFDIIVIETYRWFLSGYRFMLAISSNTIEYANYAHCSTMYSIIVCEYYYKFWGLANYLNCIPYRTTISVVSSLSLGRCISHKLHNESRSSEKKRHSTRSSASYVQPSTCGHTRYMSI